MVLNGVRSPHSRRAYARALDDFFDWYRRAPRGPFSKDVANAWRADLERRELSPSTINVRLAAIRKLAIEAADNGLLDSQLAAAIARVRGAPMAGERMGKWLTAPEAVSLLQAPSGDSRKAVRDRAILAMLVGCGLRRSELVALDIEDLEYREGRPVIADLSGKGRRVRTVAVPAWVKDRVDAWTSSAAIASGPLFRPLTRSGGLRPGRLTEKVIWWVVLEAASKAGLGNLAPHDLRRTCARLCRAAGGSLEQIQFLLGHASLTTTERYLGSRQDIALAVNDRMGLFP